MAAQKNGESQFQNHGNRSHGVYGRSCQDLDFIEEKTQGSGSGRLERARRQRADLPPLSEYVKHIDHVVNLVGIDHVCISTDWGATVVSAQGIENAAEFQNVAQALLDSGYSQEDVAKIMGENLLRVFDEVVKTAPKLTD